MELFGIKFGKAGQAGPKNAPQASGSSAPSVPNEMIDPYEMPQGMPAPSSTGSMPVDPVSTYQEFLSGLMQLKDNETVYGYGDTGEEVARIQQIVGVEPDGQWGPETERAVRAWQKQIGAGTDGLWGVETERATQDFLNRPYMQAASQANPAGMFDPRMLAPQQSPMIDRNEQRRRIFNPPSGPGYTG